MCLPITGFGKVTRIWSPLSRNLALSGPFSRKDKGQGHRPQADPILYSPCLVVRGRRAAPRCHPPRAPGTFRPARNTSNVQIPQVMREFVTRGAWTIQEWEPDQGPGLETQPRPASEGSGCSERAPREEERTA